MSNDDIVTRLRAGNGDDIVLFGMMYEAADEIERLRKLMSDYVSLWHQIDRDVSVETSKAYYAKFYEMDKEVRGE